MLRLFSVLFALLVAAAAMHIIFTMEENYERIISDPYHLSRHST